MRRGDGADRIHRRQAGHAQAAAPLSGVERPVGQADADQQRGNLRQHRAYRAQWRQVVLQHGLGAQQRHQGLRAHRQDRQHRPRRSAHGHQAARDHRGHRRRRAGRPQIQGRADGRTIRWMHPRRDAGRGRELRRAAEDGFDHGLGRHDRDGRHLVHGQRGALLHRVLHDRVVRQMHSLPRGHGADVHAAHAHLRPAREPWTTWRCSKTSVPR